RKNDPTALIRPLVNEFARSLASMIEQSTLERVRAGVALSLAKGPKTGHRRPRATVLCYFPECTNVAAPRFGMFCAAEHKKLPRAQKDEFRKQRQEAAAGGAKGRA